MPHEPNKELPKSNKIFRPWDSNGNINKITTVNVTPRNSRISDDSAQDATISTTTENTEWAAISNQTPKFDEKCESLSFIPNNDMCKHENFGFSEYSTSLDAYTLFPDLIHANLANSLGLTPTDPLFIEYLNKGCTMEEYTRIINQEQRAKLLNARKQRPKKYRCPHCEVGFSNNGQLKGHIRIHTGERPFRCDEKSCGKTFTRNEELTRHKRIHSGLRPFPCAHCGKRFGRKDHLKKHSRTHFQPRGIYALPIMLPLETWSSTSTYPFIPMYSY
ncbi:hypothetical protein FQA39_LY02533 [Lamprigera yunnana]|nr:hypothetical protein FQA39_LY02533 [Lamprigera yunnana]